MKLLLALACTFALTGCGSVYYVVTSDPHRPYLVGEYTTFARPCRFQGTSPNDEYVVESQYNQDGSITCYVYRYL